MSSEVLQKASWAATSASELAGGFVNTDVDTHKKAIHLHELALSLCGPTDQVFLRRNGLSANGVHAQSYHAEMMKYHRDAVLFAGLSSRAQKKFMKATSADRALPPQEVAVRSLDASKPRSDGF